MDSTLPMTILYPRAGLNLSLVGSAPPGGLIRTIVRMRRGGRTGTPTSYNSTFPNDLLGDSDATCAPRLLAFKSQVLGLPKRILESIQRLLHSDAVWLG